MEEKMEELKEQIDEYFMLRDLYTRLEGIEKDSSKFVPKETDLTVIRKALLSRGAILGIHIEKKSGGLVTQEKLEERSDGNDN